MQAKRLWSDHVLPFLEHCPDEFYLASCGSFGRHAELACMWRVMRLMPLLDLLNAEVVWEGQPRLSYEQYHETIEIILMFIQGRSINVPRPLPAISGLKKHGYL